MSDFSPGASISVPNSDFSNGAYDEEKIDIFLNGVLLHSGTTPQINAGERDYSISTATSLKFSFELKVDDVIDVIVYNVE